MTATWLKIVTLVEGQKMDKKLLVEVGLVDLALGCFR